MPPSVWYIYEKGKKKKAQKNYSRWFGGRLARNRMIWIEIGVDWIGVLLRFGYLETGWLCFDEFPQLQEIYIYIYIHMFGILALSYISHIVNSMWDENEKINKSNILSTWLSCQRVINYFTYPTIYRSPNLV